MRILTEPRQRQVTELTHPMASRTAIVFELADELSIESLASDLAAAGAQLVRPVVGGIWILDEEGNESRTDHAGLMAHLGRGEEASFTWWLEECHDLHCRVRGTGSIRAIEFGMEGWADDEMARLGRTLRSRFLRNDRRSVGWVFDPEGVAEDYWWDDFFVAEHSLDWSRLGLHFPEAVGVRKADRQRITGLPRDVLISDLGAFFVLSASPAWHEVEIPPMVAGPS